MIQNMRHSCRVGSRALPKWLLIIERHVPYTEPVLSSKTLNYLDCAYTLDFGPPTRQPELNAFPIGCARCNTQAQCTHILLVA